MAIPISRNSLLQGTGALAQGLEALGGSMAAADKSQKLDEEKELAESNKIEAAKLISFAFNSEDPKQQQQAFNKAVQLSPELVSNVMKANKERRAMSAKPDFQQGSGAMSGYAFNPENGSFTIDPAVSKQLTQKAEEKAAQGSILNAKDRQGINKDVTGLIKDSVGISAAAKSLAGLKASSSPSAQLAAIFKFMKSLDPTSVVREGEQQMARSTGGPADYLVGVVSQLQGEGSLPPAVFSDMVATSQNLANTAIDASNNEINSYLDTYGNTIPESFKDSLRNRIPKLIGTIEGTNTNNPIINKNKEYSPSAKKYIKDKKG